MVIVVGGMIGLGKTSVTKILADALHGEAFFEKVEGNKLLEQFYTATPEESEKNRYPFLLQLHFLSTRFQLIKEACIKNNNVLDRSIYEDLYFCKRNMELGKISQLEMSIYASLVNNMMEEIDGLPKKAPDLMVYLTGSFDTVLDRIKKRGRKFELDKSLVDYYKYIWSGYDEWIYNSYDKSDVITIDMDTMDVVNNEDDKTKLIKLVVDKLNDN